MENPMVLYQLGDEYNPDSPFYEEWEEDEEDFND